MRVVVVGATGNVGTALVRALAELDDITSIVGVARRVPFDDDIVPSAKVSWFERDITCDPLDVVDGADVVVSLAWRLQPTRHETEMHRTNVVGSLRVARAVARRHVPALVYASSVGAYSPGSKSQRSDESHPVHGVTSSTYSRHKAEVERMLDQVEADHPDLRLVRMRTSLVFQRSAAAEIHRLFMGPALPWHLPRPLRLVPNLRRLQFQATHADDIASAYVAAIMRDVRGAFNVAAEPILTPAVIAEAVHGRTVPMPEPVLRVAAQLTYRARIQPTEVGWLDMATQTPLMDTTRARDLLGWTPTRTSVEALVELLDGIGDGAGDRTAPLAPRR